MKTLKKYKENPEKEQNRFEDTFDHFKKFGFVLFPQNLQIYKNLAKVLKGKAVLEAGCGAGLGTAIMERECVHIEGTDKIPNNVKFAKELYPWINFHTWDIAKGKHDFKHQVIVCVEAIEHIKDYRQAINNLISSAIEEVYISTPNRLETETQPSNPFHVKEFTPEEMLEMIGNYETKILHWDTFDELDKNTKVNPLIYKIEL